MTRTRVVHPIEDLIHKADACAPFPCAWHRPSDHHMKDWPKSIRWDRADLLTERHCPHGIGHPDPDTMAFYRREHPGAEWAEGAGIHSCDGCCHAA